MKLSQVSLDDGRAVAGLLKLVGSGRWDLSAGDAEHLVNIKKWLQSVAGEIAKELKGQKPEAPPTGPVPITGMRIKSRGKIPGNTHKKPSGSKKK